MKQYKILGVCGAGLSTSTTVARMLQQGMEKRNMPAQIRTCKVIEATGTIKGYDPDVILSTVVTTSFENPSDAKVFSGVPLLTGVGASKLLDDIVEYLKSKGDE